MSTEFKGYSIMEISNLATVTTGKNPFVTKLLTQEYAHRINNLVFIEHGVLTPEKGESYRLIPLVKTALDGKIDGFRAYKTSNGEYHLYFDLNEINPEFDYTNTFDLNYCISLVHDYCGYQFIALMFRKAVIDSLGCVYANGLTRWFYHMPNELGWGHFGNIPECLNGYRSSFDDNYGTFTDIAKYLVNAVSTTHVITDPDSFEKALLEMFPLVKTRNDDIYNPWYEEVDKLCDIKVGCKFDQGKYSAAYTRMKREYEF